MTFVLYGLICNVCCLTSGWTVWLERKITSKVRNNPEHGKLSTQVRQQGRNYNDGGTYVLGRGDDDDINDCF